MLEKLRSVYGWLDSEYDRIPVEQAVMSNPELPGTVLRLPFTELQWTRKVADAAGWKGEIRVVAAEAAPVHLKKPGNWQQHWVADSSWRRQEDLLSRWGLEDALQQTIAWERKNLPAEVDAAQFDYAAEDECL